MLQPHHIHQQHMHIISQDHSYRYIVKTAQNMQKTCTFQSTVIITPSFQDYILQQMVSCDECCQTSIKCIFVINTKVALKTILHQCVMKEQTLKFTIKIKLENIISLYVANYKTHTNPPMLNLCLTVPRTPLMEVMKLIIKIRHTPNGRMQASYRRHQN